MGRYERMFEGLKSRGESAFVPFVVIGDPDLETSLEIARTLARAGADALELGIPFSDPIADGPTIQAATVRAIDAAATPERCFEIIRRLRDDEADIPIGILSYANLAWVRGIEPFYSSAADAGVDSVLLADVPAFEAKPFVDAARAAGVHPILIAPPNACDECLRKIAELGGGYTFAVKQMLWEHLKPRYGKRSEGKLSRAALETLSIIAYSQPVTRQEIESIRGVSADSMIKLLASKSLIREVGKKQVPGRPVQYGTTKEFLKTFRLGSIADLPKLDELDAEKFE